MTVQYLAERVMNGEYLSYNELREFISLVREDKINDLQFVAFFAAMETRNRLKGINLDETTDLIRALRIPKKIELEGILCPAGTGGDPIKTINVSTPASVILAAGGVRVLKNGFKSVTGGCGSREILEGWGIGPFQKLEDVLASVKEIGIGYYDFLNLIIKDKRSGFRSPLNYIGALSHPIKVDYKVLGCASEHQFKIIESLADKLYNNYLLSLNKEIDEISTVTPTEIIEKRNGKKTRYIFNPKEEGIHQSDYSELFPLNTPQENANCIKKIFEGKRSPKSQLIALNAGAGFYLIGKADSLKEGYQLAEEVLSSNKAAKKLEEWREFSRKNKNEI